MHESTLQNFWSQSVFSQGSVYIIKKIKFCRPCSLKENALSKVTTRFLTKDLMGKVEGPSCRVEVCERRVSVCDGEPMFKFKGVLAKISVIYFEIFSLSH